MNPKTVRLAIVGCGAVTEHFHLPVIAGHDRVLISALVDPNTERASHLARLYNVETVLPSADQIDRQVADAALLATPAFLHAPGAIALMNKGLHVLVEKPMALSLADAAQMVTAGKENGVVLTVGLFRRLLPAIRLFRAAVDAGQVGEPLRIRAEVGDAYTWQLTTLAGMRRQEAGGGMLLDMGSHLLDLLLFVFNATPRLIDYSDNGGETGVETECSIELTLHRRGIAIPTRVELSRTRTLANSIVLEGSRGTLEWKFGERYKVQIGGVEPLIDPASGVARPCSIEATWRDEPEQPGYEGFRSQIDDFVAAISSGGDGQLSGESVLPSVDLIEQCYARRKRLDEPWYTEKLSRSIVAGARAKDSSKRVLITGASGFIGCRLSERLHYGSDWNVRALLRNPGRAVRLARMPIEFAIGDLASKSDLERALEGCDAVVHAGIGTSWRESERIATNVEGTRRLVEASLAAGVKRFIHLSTIAIYGESVTGTIDESTPLNPKKGWDYAESKYAAEQIVLEACKRGLPGVILRPSVVYGPHNMTITVRPLQHLLQNRLELVDCKDVPSNTIYVDNLCHGIALALDALPDIAGRTFVLNDDDGTTWGEYFDYFANQIGAAVRYVAKLQPAPAANPPSLIKRWLQGTRSLIVSPETKALAKAIYRSEPWGSPARWGVDTFPGAVEWIKARVRPEEAFIYRPNPSATEAAAAFTVDPIHARVSAAKAARELGFGPIVTRERALELTLEWARYARVVPTRVREVVAG